MSREAEQSSRSLLQRKPKPDYRGSVNRAYYAVYCAVAHALPDYLQYSRDRRNPPHEGIPLLLRDHLSNNLGANLHATIKAFNFVRKARVTADYQPRQEVTLELSRACLKNAQQIMNSLGVL